MLIINIDIKIHVTFVDRSMVYYSVVLSIDEGKKVIQDSLDQFDNPYHSSTTCTAGQS